VTGCTSTIVARFSSTSGAGGAVITVDVTGQSYQVNWDTKASALSSQSRYRLRVLVQGTELGHADVVVVSSGAALRDIATNTDIALVDGRTLPVRFRVERGALVLVSATAGGSGTLADGAVTLSFPSGAVSGDIAVTATSVPPGAPGADASVIGGTLFEFQPSPTTFAQPVTLSLSYPATLPPGTKASRLAICKMIDGACHALSGSTVNTSTRTVTAAISGFSEYGVSEFPEMIYEVQRLGDINRYYLHTAGGEIPLPAIPERASWSPDGQRFTYVKDPYEETAELHVVNADGTGDRTLVRAADDVRIRYARLPGWSPEGSRILFNCSHGYLCVINPDGSGLVKVAGLISDNDHIWSPDGSYILVYGIGYVGGSAIDRSFWKVSPDGANVELLTRLEVGHEDLGPGMMLFPPSMGISADGSLIGFAAFFADEEASYYVMNADGTNIRRLLRDYIGNARPSLEWSPVPGDNRVLFHSCGYTFCTHGLASGIYTIRADIIGANPILVYSDGTRNEVFWDERWSTDGRRVVFRYMDGERCNGFAFFLNVDGSGLQPLFTECVHADNARWRP
jgi:Tol biopolymer transport system component